MKVLLAGGAGYIGSHTAVELSKAGYDPVIVDNYSNSSPIAISRCEEILGKSLTFYEADVTDKEALRAIFTKEQPDAVIHFAGFKSVDESVRMPLLYYRNNIDTTLSLLEVMREYDVSSFIFSSSATVYGENAQIPCVETDPTGGCTNPYGWTKLMNEEILKDAALAITNLRVVLLRYFNPAGAHESGLIGEDPKGIPNNLMPYVTQVASGKLPFLKVFGNDYPTVDGSGVRDFIHVVDLAKGHVAALEYAKNHTGVEIFNLGTGRGVSVLELVNAFVDSTGVDIPYEIVDRRPGDLAEVWANPSKAKELMNWQATKTIGDICADAWRWQSNNPQGYE